MECWALNKNMVKIRLNGACERWPPLWYLLLFLSLFNKLNSPAEDTGGSRPSGISSGHLPVTGDGIEGAIISSEGDVEPDDSVASLDHLEVLGIEASLVGGGGEEELNLFEETGLTEFVELGSKLRLGGESTRGGSH